MGRVTSKVCTKCCEEKTLEEFDKAPKGKYGRKSKCKACCKAYREANKDKIAAVQKEYYEANREKKLAYQKAYSEENKEYKREYDKAYNEANKEAIAANKKRYYQENKEEIDERNKAWKEANPDYQREYNKAWREVNKEYKRKADRDYKNKRYSEDPEFRTRQLLRNQTKRLGDYKSKTTIEIIGISAEEFWKRNGSPSVEELEDLHIDHIVPLSWFDLSNEEHARVSSHWTNLQYLNSADNLAKRNNYAGRPDAILGYKDEFDIEKHVKDMTEFINEI
jgi:hypothetical protein